MKLLLALALTFSSVLSFASDIEGYDYEVLDAIVRDLKTSNFSCNWSNMLNTMSDLEAQYRVIEHLQAPDTMLDIHSEGKAPYIDVVSTWAGGLREMDSKIVLSSDASRVTRVDFTIATLKEYTVNSGTILNPSYETRTSSTIEYKASCQVR